MDHKKRVIKDLAAFCLVQDKFSSTSEGLCSRDLAFVIRKAD